MLPPLILTAFLTAASASDLNGPSETITVATYRTPGSVCIDSGDYTRPAANSTQNGKVAITLVGFSDEIEMRKRTWEGGSPCISYQLPQFLQGHERVAAMRALQIYEIGQREQWPGFSGRPVLVVSADEQFTSNDPNVVTVVIRRSNCAGPACRKVDLVSRAVADEPPAPLVHATVLLPIPSALDPRNSVPEHGHLSLEKRRLARGFGWAAIVLGLTTAGAGGVFTGAAIRQRDAAEGAASTERRDLLEVDGYRYTRSAVWALGIGSGLVIGGAIIVGILRTKRPQARGFQRVTLGPGTVQVRW